MMMGIVVGTVVSTRKSEALVGCKFLEVRAIEEGRETSRHVIAVDTVGAGIGERVLLVTGGGARTAMANMGKKDTPVDAVIVGIVD